MSNPQPVDQTLTPTAPDSLIDGEGNFKDEQPKNTVRFTGIAFATERRIEPGQWNTPDRLPLEDKDIKDKEKAAVWNLDNRYTLPKSDFTPKQLEILESDGMFSIT